MASIGGSRPERLFRGGTAPDNNTFAFLSKSFVEAQRGAEVDLKLLSARATSLRNLADDWENIKIPLAGKAGKDVTAGELLKQLRDDGRKALSSSAKPLVLDDWEKIRIPTAGGKEVTAGQLVKRLQDQGKKAFEASTKPIVLEDLDVVKSIQQRLPPALTNLQKKLPEVILPPFSKSVEEEGPNPFPFYSDSNSDVPFWAPGSWEGREDGVKGGRIPLWQQQWAARGNAPLLKPFDGRQFTSFAEWNKAVKERRWQLPVPPDAANWDPLKRVSEGLRELQDLQSAKGAEVAPLGVPEVLENFVRTSEEVLLTLGVKPDVSAKVSHALRRCKEASRPLVGTVSDDVSLEHRLDEVMASTGYLHKNDGTNSMAEYLLRCQLSLAGAPRRGLQRKRSGGRRNVAIVTTASLPWMTGTAVNPLLRAAYLAQLGNQDVTLLVPWLGKEDQEAVFPGNLTFETPAEQESYVRGWLQQRIGDVPNFKISFYPGKFSHDKRSIFAAGDISSFVPDEEADIAVLEEPEHLAWYHHGKRWTDKFSHVVGIIHTNYLEYVKREKNGEVQSALLEHVNNWMARVHCDKVIRLSGATQNFPRASVCNVHGVGVKFLDIGDSMANEVAEGRKPFSKGAYYLGKMVWSKGYRELVDLLDTHYSTLGGKLRVDVFGSGEDSGAVQAEAQAKGLKLAFHKGRDHADSSLHGFKVFINPSTSDVVCTTTAEALAMGKIVVCADHPSNDFFRTFPNCLIYKTTDEFLEKVQLALASEPKPLTSEERHLLTWEAATHRFLQSAGLDKLSLEAPRGGVMEVLGQEQVEKMRMGIDRSDQDETLGVRRVKSLDNLMSLGGGRSDRGGLTGGLAASPASLTMSLSSPDLNELMDRFLSFSHFMLAGLDPWRVAMGADPHTKHISEQLSKDLGLPPPWVQRPSYGW